MSEEIELLKRAVRELKASIRFWKRVTTAIIINIPILVSIVLITIGIGEMNTANADFFILRTGSFILIITNIFLLIGIDLYLLFK